MEFKQYCEELVRVMESLKSPLIEEKIERISDNIVSIYREGGILLIAGNGGSGADAQHIAAENVGAYLNRNRKSFPAIALTTNTSNLTAIANDFGYDNVFLRQLQAFDGIKGIFWGISTSGESQNIIKAMEYAKSQGKLTFGLSGKEGGELEKIADECITIDCMYTPIIQTAHNAIYHWICGKIEEKYI